MSAGEVITLKRDCEAVEIPSGHRTVLSEGTGVTITQSLGGVFTVVTDRGHMVRIAGKDGDAIGQPTEPGSPASSSSVSGPEEDVEKSVWDQLRTCYDPEIPVNIADLGLIYSCFLTPLPEGGNHVEIKMTLTAPGCGMGEFLKTDVEDKILALPGIKSAAVELVWDPPWDRSMMSEAAKLELGMV